MAVIKPFRALRPVPEKAKQVSCVPYDVVYESEVREFIKANPLSFLHVTRSEAEFAEGENPAPEAVFDNIRHHGGFHWLQSRLKSMAAVQQGS